MTLVEKNKTTILAPIAIGFALFATQLAGIQYTGAAVNVSLFIITIICFRVDFCSILLLSLPLGLLQTARAFGPAVVTGDFIGSHWIYVDDFHLYNKSSSMC